MRLIVVCLFAGCATVTPPPPGPPPPPPEPNPAERACLAAVAETDALLGTDALLTCERDLDCAGVSPLVAGHCGVFVNARAFEAHRAQFEAQQLTCNPVVQLVPRCPRLRPACNAGRCFGDTIAELPDECAELRKSFQDAAKRAASCKADDECTLVGEDLPTSIGFATGSVEQQEQLSKTCGTVPPALFATRPAPVETFCVEGRCMSEKGDPKFTTVVRTDRKLTPPEIDGDCLFERFYASLQNPGMLRGKRWELHFKTTFDLNGDMNQFEFISPANLTRETQAAAAARFRECKATPVKYRGKPITVRWGIRMIAH
ncbi:MAG: hypothetical protein Q8L48_36680 [Archangium sp.]|nr:hypothetical protein [Archangium sp.]